MKHNLAQPGVTAAAANEPRIKSLALEQKAYSIEQTTRITSLGRSSIFSLIRQGRLKSVRVGRRRLILASSVDEMLREAGP